MLQNLLRRCKIYCDDFVVLTHTKRNHKLTVEKNKTTTGTTRYKIKMPIKCRENKLYALVYQFSTNKHKNKRR